MVNEKVPKESQEDQEVEEQQEQPLPKEWRYKSSHLKELRIGDTSQGVTNRSSL